jgi:hypothetical protein
MTPACFSKVGRFQPTLLGKALFSECGRLRLWLSAITRHRSEGDGLLKAKPLNAMPLKASALMDFYSRVHPQQASREKKS